MMNYHNLPKWQRIMLPAVTIMVGFFYLIQYFVADELIDTRHQVQALHHELQTALERIDAEYARATVAEREVDVIRRANALLRASEGEHQDEIAGLQADLVFYRRLGGANGSQAPLAVHSVELQSMQSPRVYRIMVTLTQNLRWASIISGRIQLGIDGIQNGAAKHVTEVQLLAESAQPLNFQFKYFQHVERLITLPEGFAPSRLSIRLKSGSLSTAVEQSMEWQNLFNQTSTVTPVNETPVTASED